MRQYIFKRFDPSLLDDFILLCENVFKNKPSKKEVENKFNTRNLASIGYLGYLAYSEDNTAAAYYGVFPCYIEYKNNIILAAQSGDTMTHSEHRGKGLFITLAKMTYQLASENGVKFIFGFPNKNSYPGFVNKLNWVHKENIKSYKIAIPTLPLSKAAKKIKFINPLYTLYTSCILSFWKSQKKTFTNSCITENTGGILRDENFFLYKSFSKNRILQINNTCVWVKIDGSLNIGDIENTNYNIEQTLSKVKSLAFLLGCNTVVVNTSPGTYLDQMLKDKYQYSEILPIGYLDMGSNIDLAAIKFTGGDFDTF